MTELRPAISASMREAIARENAQAAAERRSAQQAFRQARAAPATSAGWDKRPAPKRKPSRTAAELAQKLDQDRSRQRADWARRHPDIAAGERALRKRAAELQELHGHRRGGTAMTIELARQGARGGLARLWREGVIDDNQLAWAAEIAGVAERLTAAVSVRTASLETRIDAGSRHDTGFFESLGAVRTESAYGSWRREVAGFGPLQAVLDLIVGDPLSIAAVMRRYRLGRKRVVRLLRLALDRWPQHHLEAACAIGRRELLEAHQRLF